MSIVLLILGLILFVGLVVIHEFGHFIIARRNGVEVEEFGIGFPPRAKGWKTKKGFLFSLNWLPIGGFVKLKGENDSDKREGSLGAATTWVKAKIMLAGVAMNLLVAFLMLTFLALVGMPQLLDNQFTVKSDTTISHRQVLVGAVQKGSPAEILGLQPRDELLTITLDTQGDPLQGVEGVSPAHDLPFVSQRITSAESLPTITKQFAGQRVSVTYKHKDATVTKVAQLRDGQEAKDHGYLGVSPAEFTLQRSTWSAPIVAVGLIKQFTVATFQGLGTALGALFHGDTAKASEQVSGPVGIVVVLRDGSLLGYQFVLLIIAIISLTLAIMNVLPIPALDGGRLFVILLSRLFGKQLSAEMEERIVGGSFLFLIGLIILITFVDVRRIF